MKQIIKFSLAILMMALCSIPVNAQNSQPQSNQHQRMSREQLAKAQANYIARQLALDDATADKFVSTYCDCVKEFWALGPRVKQNRKSGNTDSPTALSAARRFSPCGRNTTSATAPSLRRSKYSASMKWSAR